MASILGTIDIEDLASPKIANVKGALQDLTSAQETFARSANGVAGFANAGATALGAYSNQTLALVQALRLLQQQLAVLTPLIQQGTQALQAQATASATAATNLRQLQQQAASLTPSVQGAAGAIQNSTTAMAGSSQASQGAGTGYRFVQQQAAGLTTTLTAQGPLLQSTGTQFQFMAQSATQGANALALQGQATVAVNAGLATTTQQVLTGSQALGTYAATVTGVARELSVVQAQADAVAPAIEQTGTALTSTADAGKRATDELERLGSRTGALAPEYAELTDASAEYIQALTNQTELQGQVEQRMQTLAVSIAGLGTSLRESVPLTQLEAGALGDLADAARLGYGFTLEQANALSRYNEIVKQGGTLNQQQVQHINEMAKQYAITHREVLGLGTATQMLLQDQRTAAEVTQKTIAGLQTLIAEFRTGAAVTTLQKSALTEMTEAAQKLAGVADIDKKAIADLNAVLKEGDTVAAGQVATLERVVAAIHATTQARGQQLTGIEQLLAAERAAQATTQAQVEQTRQYATALQLLGQQLQTGQAATKTQAAAFQQLADAARSSNTFSAEHVKTLTDLNAKIQSSIPLTKEEVQQLAELARQYTGANREALGLGTAIQQLAAEETRANAALREHAQGLALLNRQLKEGQTASAQQIDAIQQMAKAAQQGNGFTAQQATTLQALFEHVQRGLPLTAQHIAQLQQMAKGYQDTNAAALGFNQGIDQSSTRLQAFSAQAAVVSAALGGLATALVATLKESGTLAARFETLGVVQNIVARNMNLTTVEMRGQEEVIRKLGISQIEARQSVIDLAQANIALSNGSKLARAAQDLAVIAGENSSQTYNRLVTSIQTNNTMLLRQVGITTSVTAVMRDYAQQTGRSVRELTQLDRQQAIINKILEQGAQAAGSYEAAMDTAGKQMSSFSRYVQDAKQELGDGLLPVMGAGIALATQFLKTWLDAPPIFKALVTGLLAGAAAAGTLAAALAVGRFIGIVQAITSITKAIGAMRLAMGGIQGLGFFAALSSAGLIIPAVVVGIGLLTAAYIAWTGAQKENTEALIASSGEAQITIDRVETLSEAVFTQRGKVLETAKAQRDYKANIEALKKISPELVRVLQDEKSTWNDVAAAIREATRAQREHQEGNLQQVQTKINQLTAQRDQIKADYDARVATARRQMPDITQEQAEAYASRWTSGSVDRIRAINAELTALHKSREALDIEGSATKAWAKAKEDALDVLQNLGPTIAESDRLIKQSGATLEAEQARQGIRLRQLPSGAFEAIKKASGDVMRLTSEEIAALGREVEKKVSDFTEKQREEAERRKKQYEKDFEMITRGLTDQQVTQLQAVNAALAAVPKGSQEYQDRLERARPAIELYAKANDTLKNSLRAVGEAFDDMLDERTGGLVTRLTDEVMQAVDELDRSVAESMQKYGADTSAMVVRSAQERLATSRDLNQKLLEADRAYYEETVVTHMSARDQQIYQEQQRIREIIEQRNIEKRARDEAIQDMRREVRERATAARQEIQDLIRNALLRDQLRQEQAERELFYKLKEKSITQDVYDRQVADLQMAGAKTRELLQVRMRVLMHDAAQQIDLNERTQNAIIDEMAARNQEIDQIEMERSRLLVGAAQSRIEKIKDTFNDLRNGARQIFTEMATSFGSHLTRMLTGAESFAEGMKGVWNSIKQSFFNLVDSMIDKWVQQGMKQLLAGGAQTAAGGAAGGGPLGGVIGLLGKIPGLGSLLGLGSATAASGGTLLMGGTTNALGIASLPGPVTSTSATGAGMAGTGGFATSALAGGMMAAAGGGLVGYGVGSQFNSRTGGALAGAGSGALTGMAIGSVVPGIGNLVGAGIGALAGAIGGWLGGGKEAREVKKLRDEVLAANGGLENFRKTAQKAGYDIAKMLSTKDMETFKMEAMKLDTVLKFGSMEELRKRAEAVGVNIDRIFKIKDAEKFNKEMEKLNGLLAEQQKRLEAWGTVASGMTTRTTGFITGLTRDFDRIYASLGSKARETLEGAFKQAQERGFSGDRMQFMVEKLRAASEQGVNTLGLPTAQVEEFRAVMVQAQKEFDNLGKYAIATFAGVLRETGDLNAAMEAIGPTLDMLSDAQQKLGLTGSAALDKLLEFRSVLRVNEDVSKSLSGITQILKGLADAGALTQDMFTTLGNDAALQFDKLIARGVGADMAMLAMQPTLQKLWEAQDKYGYSVDATTQKLLDQAEQQGLIGDKFKETNEKILDVLMSIADALGATLPESVRRFGDAVNTVTPATAQVADQLSRVPPEVQRMRETVERDMPTIYDHVTGVAVGHSPGGVREIVTQTNAAIDAMARYRTQVAADSTVVDQNVLDMAEKFRALKPGPDGELFATPGAAPLAPETLDQIKRLLTQVQDARTELPPDLQAQIDSLGSGSLITGQIGAGSFHETVRRFVDGHGTRRGGGGIFGGLLGGFTGGASPIAGALGFSGGMGSALGFGGNTGVAGNFEEINRIRQERIAQYGGGEALLPAGALPPEELLPPPTGASDPGTAGPAVVVQQGDINLNFTGLDGQSFVRVWNEEFRPQLLADVDRNTAQLTQTLEERLARYRSRF